MTTDIIKEKIIAIASSYSIKSVILFGSRADGTNDEDSDVDLIMEFHKPISLITLAQIQYDLEELLGLNVDIIHGPVRSDDMITIGKTVEIYAA